LFLGCKITKILRTKQIFKHLYSVKKCFLQRDLRDFFSLSGQIIVILQQKHFLQGLVCMTTPKTYKPSCHDTPFSGLEGI